MRENFNRNALEYLQPIRAKCGAFFFLAPAWKKPEYNIYILQRKKYTLAVRSKTSSKLLFASCVWYSDRAHYWMCVLIKDIGRRLRLELQCSLYQGQQRDVNQSAHGNYKTRF